MQDLLPWMAPWGVWSLYLLMLIAGCALAWQGWFARRFHDHPRCPKCAYDRRGLPSATCPECGYCVIRPWEPYTSRRRRYSLLLLGLLTAVSLPSVAVTRRVRQYGWEYYRRVGPVYWMFPTETEWVYRHGDFEIRCFSDPAHPWSNDQFSGQKLHITYRGETLLEEQSLFIELIEALPAGTDLNANGYPDVVLVMHPGGNSTWHNYQIIELRERAIAKLADFGARGEGDTICFYDLDNDGILEVANSEWQWDGNTWQSSPTVLVWDGNQFTRRPYYTCARPGSDR